MAPDYTNPIVIKTTKVTTKPRRLKSKWAFDRKDEIYPKNEPDETQRVTREEIESITDWKQYDA